MNGVRKRRFPVIVASCSILVLVVSVVTAQQVFDRNRQPAFVRRQTIFQQQPNQIQFQQNRNFVLPSASPLRQRNLFTRQISHRHRPRQRSKASRTTTHPAHLTTRRVIPTLSHKRTRSRTKPNVTSRVTSSSNQRTTTIKSNISRRQPFIQRQQQFRFQPQRVQRVQTFQRGGQNQNAQFVMRPGVPRSPFAIRAPLSPMPFGSVQRTPSSLRRPVSQNRLSLRPPPSSPSTQILTTTTPSTTVPPTSPVPTTTVSLPSSTHVATVHSVGGSLRRPIRVQQLQLNLRRKPQMTRGQFRRPKNFPLTRHQPTHRVTKPDRVTRPIVSTTTLEPTTEDVSFTVAGTTPEGIQTQQSELKKVDDIEAAILQAVIESSSPEPPPSSTTTHRPRIHRIRPGHRHRPASSPPRVDAIEEAVLRAVLEATPASPPSEDVTTTPVEETTTTTLATAKTEETTTEKPESTSLFPAFARGRHGHRRPTTVIPRTTEEPTTTESTTTELVTTTTTEATTTTSEEPTTTVTEGTTTEQVTGITIALPEEDFEDINAKTETENHQLHQIEKNVISALSTPTASSDSASSPSPPSPLPPIPSSSPVPPSPPAPPHEFAALQAGPPGSMPPSDDIVDELNGSSDFLQVAQRLHLLRRLLQ